MTSIESRIDYFDRMGMDVPFDMIQRFLSDFWNDFSGCYKFFDITSQEYSCLFEHKTLCHIKFFLQETKAKVLIDKSALEKFIDEWPEVFDKVNLEVVDA